MYNEERKLRFLDEERQSRQYGASIFHATEEVESAQGKDLCELDSGSVQALFENHFGFRKRAIDTALTLMKSYVQWCDRQGFRVSNGIFDLHIDYSEKLRRMMVANPTHLESILNDIFEPVESQTVDCLYRCYLWMAFFGLKDTEALALSVENVDFENHLIHSGNMDYEIYSQAYSAFRMACTSTSFVYVHNNPRYETTRDRSPGTRLMRGIRGDLKLTTVRASVKHKLMDHNYDLSYNRIRLSGIFYRAFETERAGFQFDFSPFVMEQLTGKERHYTDNYTKSKVAYAIRRDLLDDYSKWKEAFSV